MPPRGRRGEGEKGSGGEGEWGRRRKPDRQGGCRQQAKLDRERQTTLSLDWTQRLACMLAAQIISKERQTRCTDCRTNIEQGTQTHRFTPSPFPPFSPSSASLSSYPELHVFP
jgi:hypothetical protein